MYLYRTFTVAMYSLEHRAAHVLGHLVYVHISCISRASYILTMLYEKIPHHVTIVTYTKTVYIIALQTSLQSPFQGDANFS